MAAPQCRVSPILMGDHAYRRQLPGYNAAQVILADLGITADWMPPITELWALPLDQAGA